MPQTGEVQSPSPARRNRRRSDLAIGIALGLVLGVVVVYVFVFLDSEGSIDAPRITGANPSRLAQHPPGPPGTATSK